MSERKRWVVTGTIFTLLFIFILFFIFRKESNNSMIFGVSFNPEYAEYLGLNPQQVYGTILDEWRFRYLRFSAQWDIIERERGKYDFSQLDWLLEAASQHKATAIVAVGQKTPRWPECHIPGWAVGLKPEEYRAALLEYIGKTVEHFRDHPALELWQVENEPFLAFGACSTLTKEMLKEELGLVKQLDPQHPTLTTDSGELSTWRKTARVADLFGTTLYRVVWDKDFGYFSYNWLPAWVYRFKLWLNGRSLSEAYITELQAEPWIPNRNILNFSVEDQYKSMSFERLKKNVEYARRTGFPRAYLWGAEWWYWLEKQGKPAISAYIKDLKKY